MSSIASLFRAFMRRDAAKPDSVPAPDFDALERSTNFKKRELKKLFTRFCLLCNPVTGYIERIPFVQQAEFAFCPLISLAFEYELSEQKKSDNLRKLGLRKSSSKSQQESGKILSSRSDHILDTFDGASNLQNEQDIPFVDSGGGGEGGPDHESATKIEEEGGLDFDHFVNLLSLFSPKETLSNKASCKRICHNIQSVGSDFLFF